jgi:hypothetical protein
VIAVLTWPEAVLGSVVSICAAVVLLGLMGVFTRR